MALSKLGFITFFTKLVATYYSQNVDLLSLRDCKRMGTRAYDDEIWSAWITDLSELAQRCFGSSL